MPPPANWQFAVEIFPPDWRFPASPSWVAGWISGGLERPVSDLRAWLDDRPFLGLHGLPKPQLDAHLLGRAGPPYAGFSFLLEPHRDARLFRIEVRDEAGHWTEFFRTTVTSAPECVPAPMVAPLAARLAELAPALLRFSTRWPGQSLAGLADEVLAASLARPLNSLPVPPFHGALEEPRATGRLRYGRLAVTGWLAHRTARITRLTALADATQETALLHGLPRADVGDVFADLPGRETSQFAGHVDLPAGGSVPALLKIFAELDNGEKHLVFAQRFVPRVIAGADAPLPALSRRTFARAIWALRGAASRLGLPLGSAGEFWSAVQSAWAAYRAEAPPRTNRRPLPPPPAPAAETTAPLRLLVVTHNLNFEGAPWFIFELARYFAQQPGASVRIVSPQDGPLRQVFVAAGMPVEVLDVAPAVAAKSPAEFQSSLQTAARQIDWNGVDLVVANTMVSFWAVHLARAAGKPSLLYVHESSAIRRFFEPLLAPALFPVVEDAFRHASRVVFTADSSRLVFDYLNGRGNFVLLPSWVDVPRIDAFAAAHDRASLRRKHGFDPDAMLVVNVGSVCERKGQHVFIRAVELLHAELPRTHPGRRIQFVMVGARPGVYLDSLKQEIALHGLAEATFFPETGDIYDIYRLADLFVCTSFEESFPRVLLESAAFRLPIVTTNVNGIAEMLAPDEAWITGPGDRTQLADALRQALVAHFSGDTSRALKARASIEQRFHENRALPLHLALARTTLPSSA